MRATTAVWMVGLVALILAVSGVVLPALSHETGREAGTRQVYYTGIKPGPIPIPVPFPFKQFV